MSDYVSVVTVHVRGILNFKFSLDGLEFNFRCVTVRAESKEQTFEKFTKR